MSLAQTTNHLQLFLDQDIHQEMMTYIQAHGYLTALCICPEQIPDQQWLSILFGEDPQFESQEQRQQIELALTQLKTHIMRMLLSDDELQLPCDIDPGDELESSEIHAWCIGFMEGVFLCESAWFDQNEEEVSELLLPIMVGSKLFDDQPEFAEVVNNPDLIADMLENIPALITNLYLLCNAPDEKPAILKNHH